MNWPRVLTWAVLMGLNAVLMGAAWLVLSGIAWVTR
jgi:hypothetical protein